MEYNINIYQDDDKYYANINIDGFQTTQRIRADVIGNAEGIDMVFETYLSESTGENIEKGEILLSFKKENSEINTYWGAIQPILPENIKIGKVYFTKVKTSSFFTRKDENRETYHCRYRQKKSKKLFIALL